MIREQQQSRFGALRLLSHALSGHAPAACKLLIERKGLATLFPVLMVTPTVRFATSHLDSQTVLLTAQHKLKKVGQSELQFEEYILSIITALFRNATPETYLPRLLGKFMESDFSKVGLFMPSVE